MTNKNDRPSVCRLRNLLLFRTFRCEPPKNNHQQPSEQPAAAQTTEATFVVPSAEPPAVPQSSLTAYKQARTLQSIEPIPVHGYCRRAEQHSVPEQKQSDNGSPNSLRLLQHRTIASATRTLSIDIATTFDAAVSRIHPIISASTQIPRLPNHRLLTAAV